MKHVITFFGLAYIISWLIWLPLYGQVFGIHDLPVLPFQHALGGLGPMIAAFIASWLHDGSKGVRVLARRFRTGKHWLYLIIALLSPFILAALAAAMNAAFTHKPVDISGLFRVKEFPGFNLLSFFLYNLVFFGFGEEAGWRGFALPALQSRYNALISAIILTFFWALWHWPAFLYRPGYMGMGIAGITGWIFSLLTGSILLTWLFNSSKGSLMICAIFHATVDIAFTADFADRNTTGLMGLLITLWGIITIIVFRPRNLSRIRRTMLE